MLEFVQSSKNIINTDSDDKNEMNNAAPDPATFKMRNIVKSMLSYLDAHSNEEMKNKMDDIEHQIKKTKHKKISNYFLKTQYMFCFSKNFKIVY